MYRHEKNNDRWAQPVTTRAKYVSNDGQGWDGDETTIRFLRSLERPNRESDQGQFKAPLTSARIVEVLEDTGYVDR